VHGDVESGCSDRWVVGDDWRRDRECTDGAGVGDGIGGREHSNVHGDGRIADCQPDSDAERDPERLLADIWYLAGGSGAGFLAELRVVEFGVECEHDVHGDVESGCSDWRVVGDDWRRDRECTDGAGVGDGVGGREHSNFHCKRRGADGESDGHAECFAERII
jgi:hypothetical protein